MKEAASVGGLSPNPLVKVDHLTPIQSRIDVADAAAFGTAKVSAHGLPRPIRQAVKLQVGVMVTAHTVWRLPYTPYGHPREAVGFGQ
jgi:hypothetical protein